MGSLDLPKEGLIYLDTSPVIYAVEKIPPYAELLQPLWLLAASGKVQLVGSELLILETLVKPIQLGDQELITAFQNFLASQEMTLLPISSRILEKATQYRAKLGIKTPDAIHIATARLAKCDLCVTNDKAFTRVPNLNVTVLQNCL